MTENQKNKFKLVTLIVEQKKSSMSCVRCVCVSTIIGIMEISFETKSCLQLNEGTGSGIFVKKSGP